MCFSHRQFNVRVSRCKLVNQPLTSSSMINDFEFFSFTEKTCSSIRLSQKKLRLSFRRNCKDLLQLLEPCRLDQVVVKSSLKCC